ncbi:glycosyltransferase family 39 protein [Nemorincola caseinilytica]|uniref:glycosyltransferase family 39 protein n=1 Tax=Nemorincola caseinilytica TaxID=2054315 RepID=UPI0031EAF1A5
MSKNQNKQRTPPQPAKLVQATPAAERRPFGIPYPMLLLVLAVVAIYFPSFSLGFTELDDTIFIREFRAYNEDTGNLLKAFTRGLFDATKDPYYRPLFSDAMILNYQATGDEPAGYHLVNILLHMGAVLLFYRLTVMLGVKRLHGFLLALVFAVHPVLTQAVAWIPGRNDTMLAVFVLLFMQYAIRYVGSNRPVDLILSGIWLLCAYFTKETAVFAAPAMLALLVLYMGRRWNEKPLVTQYIVWAVCFVIWYGARAAATTAASGIGTADAMGDLVRRLPVLVQYIGKMWLPFNLSVFPMQQDTVLWYGIVAIVLMVAVVLLNKGRNEKAVAAALIIMLLFLMPALLVPEKLNKQTFEHRLYLPMMGMLLLLPQTILLANKLEPRRLTMIWVAVCVFFGAYNNRHQQHFADPLSFWTQAAETSPNSAYANMMLAARLEKTEFARSEELFRKAYRLDPREKYLNYYMAEVLQRKDSVLASEKYLLVEKEISDYVQCDFYLARVYMEKGDKQGAINVLERFLRRAQGNMMAHNNLLLLYMELGHIDKARTHIKEMRAMGLDVPPQIAAQAGA